MGEVSYEFNNVTSVEGAVSKANIDVIQQELEQHAQLDLKLEHYFSKGLYARKLHLPQGSINVSKVHKYPSLSIIATGSVRVASTLGLHTYKAGDVIVAPPGMRRVVCALEDTIWVTVHENPHEERDLERIERELIE
jgi:quercetin dioxygenase-like cupin family protein